MKLYFKDSETITQLIWLEYCVDINVSCQTARENFECVYEGFVDIETLEYDDIDELHKLDIWKKNPKLYEIKEHVTWEQFENIFLINGCVIDIDDKSTFLIGEISTEEYDEFIINKLLEMKYIELAEVENDD